MCCIVLLICSSAVSQLQVIYQFSGQHTAGIAASGAPPSVNIGGPQVILAQPHHHSQFSGQHPHHQHQTTASQPFAVLPTQLPSQTRQHSIPSQQVQVIQQRE